MQEDNYNDVTERENQIDHDFAVVSQITVAFFVQGIVEEYVAAELKEHNNWSRDKRPPLLYSGLLWRHYFED